MDKFSERVTLHWWHYAFPVVTLIFMLLCSVASVVWKAAKNNPVEALKDE
jgi:ABC-type antimicrobial peptide transport system permease subunit